MPRFAIPLFVAAAAMVGVMGAAPQPAEARSGRSAAGLVIGAVVGGLIAREIYRRDRRRYYSYSYAPKPYYGYGYNSGYYRDYGYRRHYRYGW